MLSRVKSAKTKIGFVRLHVFAVWLGSLLVAKGKVYVRFQLGVSVNVGMAMTRI